MAQTTLAFYTAISVFEASTLAMHHLLASNILRQSYTTLEQTL